MQFNVDADADMQVDEVDDDFILSQYNDTAGRDSSCDDRFHDTDGGDNDDGDYSDLQEPPELLHNSESFRCQRRQTPSAATMRRGCAQHDDRTQLESGQWHHARRSLFGVDSSIGLQVGPTDAAQSSRWPDDRG